MNKFTISQRGLDLIKGFESFSPRVYLCSAGKRTIGYGHVLRPADKFTVVTREQADDLLAKDCNICETYINALPLELSQNEFDALVSLTFNIGLGNFEKSTLLKRLRAGDKYRAAQEFLVWNKVRNKATGELELSKGLQRRRCRERELFLEPPQ